MSIRSPYDTTQLFVSYGTSHTLEDTITTYSRQASKIRRRLKPLRHLSLNHKHIATQGGNFTGFQDAFHTTATEEANIKLLELLGENSILYDYRDLAY